MKFGPMNSNWREDKITYRAAHVRVASVKGKATEYQCYCCGEQAHEWSYDGCDPHEQTDPRGRVYSPRVEHYDAFCRSCHRFNDSMYRRAVRAAQEAAQSFLEPDGQYALIPMGGVGA